MTTHRQMKALLRPLAERHPDLALVGPHFLAIKPVRHILCGVNLDRTSGAVGFNVNWGMRYLFRPRDALPMNDRVPGWWAIDAEGIADRFRDMVESELLPWMRSVTLSTYVAEGLARDRFRETTVPPHELIFVHAALGELNAARAIWEQVQTQWAVARNRTDFRYAAVHAQLIALSFPLLADDRAGIAALLHAWELQSVIALDLKHIWERTAFPIEQFA